MKEEKFKTRSFSTHRKYCPNNFIDIDKISKYGSIFSILVAILIQCINIATGKNFNIAFSSILFNLFFLLIILQKTNIINISLLDIYVSSSLKLLFALFLINSLIYIFVDDRIYNFIYAPLSFFGAYFIFLLIKS